MRKVLLTSAMIATLTSFVGPADLEASEDLSSSLVAVCTDPTCSQITFSLEVQGQVFLSNLFMQSLDPSLWKFGSLVAVFDSDKNDVSANWLPGSMVSPDELMLVSGTATFAPEPIHFVVNMVQPPNGTRDDIPGNIGYLGNGYATLGAGGVGIGRFSTSGTVTITPEPSALVLLGTGLFGLAGVLGRRRRKDRELRDEAA